MNKLTKLFLILLALLVSGFLIYLFVKSNAKYTVLKVVDGDTVYIDFNNNGIAERNEKKGLSDIVAFKTRPGYRLNRQMKDYNLTQQEVLELGYLAWELLKEKVLNKKVKVKFTEKKKYYALLYLNEELVQDKLIESGYVVPYYRSNRYRDNSRQVEQARKLLQGRDLKEKPRAYEEKVLEKPIPDVKTENIELYFIDPTKYDKPARYCRTSACQALLREIKNAKESIYFAIYGISSQPEIFNALVEAQKRGVKVQGVTDMTEHGVNIYPDTELLIQKLGTIRTDYDFQEKHNIPNYKHKLDYQGALMHDKFFILDKKRVWTGSTNISSTGTGGFNSNVGVLIKAEPVASLYVREFNQMYNKNFHWSKELIKNNENLKLSEETLISVYFSPKHKDLMVKITELIDNAQEYIYIPIFFLTRNDIAESLVKAKERSVDVKLIVDATCAKGYYCRHRYLRSQGIPVKTENFSGKMHMKSAIIDDKHLIIGSMNWTKHGSSKNDENTLIIHNSKLVKSYKEHFIHLWSLIPDKYLSTDPKPEGPDTPGSCSDGIDNDHDKYKDMEDYDCSKP